MSRQTYAAKQLVSQVRALRPRVTVVPSGEPDGFGVVRGVRFDKRTSKWLTPLLELLDDPRITSLDVTEAGYLTIRFVDTAAADNRTPFPLEDAETVLAGR